MKRVFYSVKVATVIAAIMCVAACGNRGQNSSTKENADALATTLKNDGAADATAKASGTAGSLTWSLTGDGTLTISGTGAMPDYDPESSLATWSGEQFTKVVIAPGVSSIGDAAFMERTDLTSVTIPESVTKIGTGAFYNCTGLTSITIPESVTEIGAMAFFSTGLTSVTIPNSVTEIGNRAFYFCEGLTSVTLSERVTVIGDGTFANCTGLMSVIIPSSVTEIFDNAFPEHTELIAAKRMVEREEADEAHEAKPEGQTMSDYFCYAESVLAQECITFKRDGTVELTKVGYDSGMEKLKGVYQMNNDAVILTFDGEEVLRARLVKVHDAFGDSFQAINIEGRIFAPPGVTLMPN